MVNVLDNNLNSTLNASSDPGQRMSDINTPVETKHHKKHEKHTSNADGGAVVTTTTTDTPVMPATTQQAPVTTSFPYMPVLLGIGLGGAIGHFIVPQFTDKKNYYVTIGLAALGGLAFYFYNKNKNETSSFSGSSSRTNPSRITVPGNKE